MGGQEKVIGGQEKVIGGQEKVIGGQEEAEIFFCYGKENPFFQITIFKANNCKILSLLF